MPEAANHQHSAAANRNDAPDNSVPGICSSQHYFAAIRLTFPSSLPWYIPELLTVAEVSRHWLC